MYKVLLILCIPFLNFSQEKIQDLLELGVHSAFETKNQSHIRHFESSNYKLLISEKSHVVQIGIWKNDDDFNNPPLHVFKNEHKIFDGRLGAYKLYFHDVNDTFDSFSNFIEIYNDAGTSPDGWQIILNTYYFSSRLPFLNKLYDWKYNNKILKSGKHKKNIRFNHVWYYSGCSG